MESEALDAGTLFRRHATFVARLLARLGAAATDVDDLVQEVFIVAHRRGGFVPGRAKATTWLAEISFRVASDHRRGRRRVSKRVVANEDAVHTATSGAPDPHRTAVATRALDRVQRALNEMPLERRAVFVLYEIEDVSCAEIALGLELPVGTVYSRLHKARREFRLAYERLTEEPVRLPARAVGGCR